MKKYTFMAIAAFATVVLVGCKEKPEVDPNAKVVINPKTLEVAVGEQGKLRAALSPSKDGVTITYTSDNKEIATVDASGLVSGVAAGTVNIIATAKDYKSDTCVVTVTEKSDAFAWGGMFFSRNDKWQILNDKDTALIQLSTGEICHCLLATGSGFFWDQNIFMDNSSQTGLAGEGYIVFVDDFPVYQILDSLDEKGPNFYYLSAREAYIVDAKGYDIHDTAYAYCVSANALGSAAQQLQYLYDETGDVESAISGPEFWYITDATTFQGYSTVALLGNGIIAGSASEVQYKMNIGWFTEEHIHGLKAEQGEDGKWAPVEPAEWASVETKYYEKINSSESAPRRMYKVQVPNEKLENTIKHFKTKKTLDKFHVYK